MLFLIHFLHSLRTMAHLSDTLLVVLWTELFKKHW